MSDDYTSADFAWIEWEAIAPRESADCAGIAKAVTALQNVESDSRRHAALDVLLDLLSVFIQWHPKPSSPLGPEHVVGRIPRSALTSLVAQVPRIGSADLRARILDLAWLKRACAHGDALNAVDAYLEDFAARCDPMNWPAGFARLQRAVDLSASLGRSSSAHLRSLDVAEAKLTELNGTDPLYLSARLMELMLKYQRGNANAYAALCSTIATTATNDGDFDRALAHLEIEVRWWNRAKDTQRATETRLRIARTMEAKARAQEPRMRAHSLADAIEAYRQHPDGKADAGRLRIELQAVQREAMQHLAKHEVSTDVSEIVAHARSEVSGRPHLDALVALCGLNEFRPLDNLRTEVREQVEETPFRAFIPRARLSTAGRVIERSGPVLDDPESFTAAMRENLTFHQTFVTQAAILPALETIRLEHGLRLEDFLALTTRSPFVPEKRERSFARGLLEGFYGDFDAAAHLLVPQLENAIRALLEAHGAVTTTLSSGGTQNEKDLNQLLLDPLAISIFGEALVFDLQTLLTEKSGTNLRNELAHGLIDDGTRVAFAYCWWLVLRLVLTPLLARVAPNAAPGPDEPVVPPEPTDA